MLTGAEIWNEARVGTPDEWAAVATLGSQVVKLRPYAANAQYWPTWLCNTARGYLGDPLLLLRRGSDGLIDPSGQVEEIRPWIAAAKQYRLRVVYILDNEPNHPASPYRTLGLGRYRRDLGELILAIEREYPALPLASPPMAVMHDDLAWLEALAGDYYMWGLEYHCCHLYWEYGNAEFTDWGRRIEQYSAICPDVVWLVDEIGDATPIGEKDARARSDAVLSVLRYLQSRGDVAATCLFLPCGGTSEWARYQLPVEELARIRAGMEEPVSYNVGEGFTKTEHLIGPWMENEAYHAPNTNHETSLAIGERGYATWRRATNETVAHTDAGEIWSDLGNLGDGSLVRIYPLALAP